MDQIERFHESAKLWLIRLLLFEGAVLLTVHVLCVFCYYGLASFVIVVSAMLILFIAMRPSIIGPIFFADLAAAGAQRLFWGRKDRGLELVDQYVRIAKLAMALHCAILLRIVMTPFLSGFTEHIPPFAIAAFGAYAVNNMLNDGFSESIRKFCLTTSVMAIAYAALSLFPPDTKIGFTFKYLQMRNCSCDANAMRFNGAADLNPVCMFNPYSGEAKIVIGQDSKLFDPLYRAPVQCRPREVPHQGFDYQSRSICFSGRGRINSNAPERMVPFSKEDAVAMNYYIQLMR